MACFGLPLAVLLVPFYAQLMRRYATEEPSRARTELNSYVNLGNFSRWIHG